MEPQREPDAIVDDSVHELVVDDVRIVRVVAHGTLTEPQCRPSDAVRGAVEGLTRAVIRAGKRNERCARVVRGHGRPHEIGDDRERSRRNRGDADGGEISKAAIGVVKKAELRERIFGRRIRRWNLRKVTRSIRERDRLHMTDVQCAVKRVAYVVAIDAGERDDPFIREHGRARR